MNQTFSFARFSRLHRWLWANKGRTYLIGIAVLAVVGSLSLSRVMTDGHITYNASANEGHLVFFVLLTTILLAGIGSDVFSALFRQESAITYLMLPASRSEKFWLGVLYCLVSLTVFTVVYFGFELFAFSVANGHLKPGETRYISSLTFYADPPSGAFSRLHMLLFYLLLVLIIALLGSFYFRKGVLVRNIGVGLLLVLGSVLLNRFMVATQFSGQDVSGGPPFLSQQVADKNDSYMLYLPAWLTYTVYGFTLLMLWVIARVRFNEIER